jgi:5,10-methylene-tetrahydrofolate dehydrogenase/methenyl tetrahydrofolate cyclohydrolase
MQKILNVYYDYPNSASDTYLKYLTKDCEANNIKVNVINNVTDWKSRQHGMCLFLKPTIANVEEHGYGNVDEPSATATGIYNYITKMYPNREMVIGVIGRGNVGKELLDMLIDYGYTVIEMNSKTKSMPRDWLSDCCNILVGLSSQDNVLNTQQCDFLTHINHCVLIDASNNFPTTEKLRCGKWTRAEIINRINKYYGE